MSWQTYVDTSLVGSQKITKAAILGQQGGVWATSSGFTLSAEEQKAVINAFQDRDAVLANGIRLAGVKYFTTTAEVGEPVVIGKKGNDGCVLAKSSQAILVAVYQAPILAQQARQTVEDLKDYLVSVSY